MSEEDKIDQEEHDETKNPAWFDFIIQKPHYVAVITLGVVTLILIIYLLLSGGTLGSFAQWGQFGDYFGGVLNPILSFIAIIVLLITIRLQSKELKNSTKQLKHSADELELSRIELEKSSKALQDQSKSLRIQNFEHSFFQMIRVHHDIVNDLDLRNKDTQVIINQGRDCFKKFYNTDFKTIYVKDYSNLPMKMSIEKKVHYIYEKFFDQAQSDVGHYFRNLYHIIKFVDKNDVIIDKKNKKKYTSIIRAQLSTYELLLLFYNSLHSVGRKKFKELIERYELLENMDVKLLQNPDEHVPLYNKEAYGDQVVSGYFKNKPK